MHLQDAQHVAAKLVPVTEKPEGIGLAEVMIGDVTCGEVSVSAMGIIRRDPPSITLISRLMCVPTASGINRNTMSIPIQAICQFKVSADQHSISVSLNNTYLPSIYKQLTPAISLYQSQRRAQAHTHREAADSTHSDEEGRKG